MFAMIRQRSVIFDESTLRIKSFIVRNNKFTSLAVLSIPAQGLVGFRLPWRATLVAHRTTVGYLITLQTKYAEFTNNSHLRIPT